MRTAHQLDNNTRYWFNQALQWADERWNANYNLVRMPLDRQQQGIVEAPYIVRDSIWYAVGLLLRQEHGDAARAQAIIKTIMSYQFDEPVAVYHGTFLRYHGEPHPMENAVIWHDYDPNWREFIGTVFIVMLKEFSRFC